MEQDSIKFFTDERQRYADLSKKLGRYMQTENYAMRTNRDKDIIEKQKMSADIQVDMLTKVLTGDFGTLSVSEVFATILIASLLVPPFSVVVIEDC